MRAPSLALLAALAVFGGTAGAQGETTAKPVDVDKWMKFIAPRPAEAKWRAIEWQPTLWDAVIAAHREKKPILLWTMNGHPLACT